MYDEPILTLQAAKVDQEQRARSLEHVEEVAWDLMNAALAMSIAMSGGDQEDGRERILEWLNGDGILEEHLSGNWDDLSILNGELEIKVKRHR